MLFFFGTDLGDLGDENDDGAGAGFCLTDAGFLAGADAGLFAVAGADG